MHSFGNEELELLKRVVESKRLMRYRGGENGFTMDFESKISQRLKVKHALTVNSGTNALYCAMVAMGIGPGDEVIVPAFTWVATPMAPLLAGAVPVLADINQSLAIDPEDIERKITPYTKAIIPVHMSNTVCDMDAIMAIAKRHNLLVCEDACQAAGITYHGREVGSIGQTAALSFNMYKNLTCGEGGMLLTDNDRYYERALIMHDAGCYTREHAGQMQEQFFPGFNFRVSDFQGAMLCAQLEKFDSFISGLKERRDLVRSILGDSQQFSIVPANDPDGVLSVHINFASVQDAAAFKEKHGTTFWIESGRHVYTNWTPVLNKSWWDERLNPHKFAHRQIDYSPDSCSRTLDILRRSAQVGFGYNSPLADVESACRKLLQ